MVPYDDVFSLPVTAKLDKSTMELIARLTLALTLTGP